MSDIEKQEDDFAMIERYYKHGNRLTKRQQEKAERWELAFSILRHTKNKSLASRKYKQLMERQGIALTDADVFKDFKHATQIFAPIGVYSKDFLRMVLTEAAMKRIDMNTKRAAHYFNSEYETDADGKTTIINKTKDIKSYETLMRLIQKDEELIMKINALDSTDPELPNFARLEMNQITVNIDSTNQKLLSKIMEKGSFDFNDIEDATTE